MMTLIRTCIALLMIVVLHGCGGDGIAGTGIGSDGDDESDNVVVGPSTDEDPVVGGDSASPPPPPSSSVSAMHGTVEKGPFESATIVEIAPVGSDGEMTREPADILARNDLGSYSFSLYQAVMLQMVATGRYYNEVTSQWSAQPITLSAYLDAKNQLQPRANINVLTHLAFARTRELLRSGVNEQVAIVQARDEVVAELSNVFGTATVPLFTELSVYDSSTSDAAGNGYLLAVSASVMRAAMQRANANSGDVDSSLTAMLDEFAADFEFDGTLDNRAWLDEVAAASRLLDPDAVRSSLRVLASQVTLTERVVADLNRFIDTDGDDTFNATDTDDDNDSIPDAEDPQPYLAPASAAVN